MKLFHWQSDALKNYSQGDIVAIGADVEQARANARKHFAEVASERWAWFYEKWPDRQPDEDEIEERDTKMAALEADIAKDPVVVDTAVFIQGGE